MCALRWVFCRFPTRVYVYVCVRVCVHVSVRTCVSGSVAATVARLRLRLCLHSYVIIFSHTHSHIHTHTHTHTHTNTYTLSLTHTHTHTTHPCTPNTQKSHTYTRTEAFARWASHQEVSEYSAGGLVSAGAAWTRRAAAAVRACPVDRCRRRNMMKNDAPSKPRTLVVGAQSDDIA